MYIRNSPVIFSQIGSNQLESRCLFPKKVPLWKCFEVENVGGGGVQLERTVYVYYFTRLTYRTAGLKRVALYKLKTNLLIWV